jgi:hypothetical protein
MPSVVRLKLPPLPPYPIWSEATVTHICSSLLRSLLSPESGPPLKQAIRMVPPPLPSSSNRLVVLAPGRAPIERLTAAQTEHVAPELLSSPGRLTIHITERSLPTDEPLRHQCRPRHLERVALPSPSKSPQRRSERVAPSPPCPRPVPPTISYHASAPVSTSMSRPRATAKAERLSAVTKLPPPCTKGCAPPVPSLPCRCPCSPVFPPLATCKVFKAMPEPWAASIAPTKSSVLLSKGYLAWLGSFPLLWSVARWFSLTFSMLRTTGISAGDRR